MDEMFFKKLEEDEVLRQEAESLQKQFEVETGGYSDIDLIYAKKQNAFKATQELDDDELDSWIASMKNPKKEEPKPEDEKKETEELEMSEHDKDTDQSMELP